MVKLILCLFTLLSLPTLGITEEFEITWHTINAGGEMFSTGEKWTLSGTIGQWEVETTTPKEGGSWSLSEGFWAMYAPETDLIYKDSFEG